MMTSAINRIRYVVLVLLSAIGININISTAHAETFALLMGVSGYPSVRSDLRLRGAANDVRIMKDRLLEMGISSNQIRILADGVSGSINMPTRNNILNELQNLTQKVHAGDWVVIYWAGHGSVQPGKESNGFDEIFLPYDIGQWDGEIGSVKNAILDDEIGNMLETFSRRNAYVWAIFDTCHAGGMNREDDCSPEGCPIERAISPHILKIPSDKIKKMRSGNGTSVPSKDLLPPPPKQIHFYAAPPHQKTRKEPKEGDQYYGVFTYHLSNALKNWDGDFSKLQKTIKGSYKPYAITKPAFQGSVPNFPVKR